jgi:hypothetical protein
LPAAEADFVVFAICIPSVARIRQYQREQLH